MLESPRPHAYAPLWASAMAPCLTLAKRRQPSQAWGTGPAAQGRRCQRQVRPHHTRLWIQLAAAEGFGMRREEASRGCRGRRW